MRSISRVLALAAAVLLAACGSSSEEGPSPEEEVREAAVAILASKDAERVCTQLMTERFLQDVYLGDPSRCIEVARTTEDPGRPRVDGVALTGDRADVRLSVDGGAADGVSGTVELAREGGIWKLDRLGADYLRASFDAAIGRVDTGALSVPPMRACMSEQAATMPEPMLRRFMYQATRHDPKAARTTIAIAERCPDALATYVAGEIQEVLDRAGDTSPAFDRCALRHIRFQLEATGLASRVLKHNTSAMSTAALQALALGTATACKRRLG